MEQAIAFTVGFSVFFISLSCLIRTDLWIEWCRRFQEGGEIRSLTLGTVSLFISSLIVGFHPVWNGPAMLITILGVIGMIESVIYLLFPAVMVPVWAFFIRSPAMFRLSAGVGVLAGAFILYNAQIF